MAFVISVVSSFLILRFIKRMKDGHGDGINFTEFAPKSRLAMTKLSMTASLWVFSDEFCSNCRIRNEHWAHGRKLFIGLVFSPFASMLDILSTWTSDHLGENSQVLEIVMSTPGVFEVLQQLVHIYPTRVLGVGTILNIEDAERAVIAGAKFFMSPVKVKEADGTTEETKKSSNLLRKLEKRQKDRTLDSHIEEQFSGGRLLACISSRPGQCGRSDGYILEGKELEFYMKKLQRKKGKAAGAAA